MLRIENLHATVAGKPILKGLSLSVNAGKVHAIMGPNGAGKSTLGYVLGGRGGWGGGGRGGGGGGGVAPPPPPPRLACFAPPPLFFFRRRRRKVDPGSS